MFSIIYLFSQHATTIPRSSYNVNRVGYKVKHVPSPVVTFGIDITWKEEQCRSLADTHIFWLSVCTSSFFFFESRYSKSQHLKKSNSVLSNHHSPYLSKSPCVLLHSAPSKMPNSLFYLFFELDHRQILRFECEELLCIKYSAKLACKDSNVEDSGVGFLRWLRGSCMAKRPSLLRMSRWLAIYSLPTLYSPWSSCCILGDIVCLRVCLMFDVLGKQLVIVRCLRCDVASELSVIDDRCCSFGEISSRCGTNGLRERQPDVNLRRKVMIHRHPFHVVKSF